MSPIELFRETWARAEARVPQSADHAAVTLATADAAGRPSARVVLLRGVDEGGFVFYTNYRSRKAAQLAENPHAALCFYWYWIDEQVRAEGRVQRVSEQESDAYFRSRPRGNQVGAWASAQSAPLASREVLEQRFREAEARFAGGDVPRPDYWGGYRLVPERLEFWTARADRLHARRLFTRAPEGWADQLLFP